MPDSIKAIFLVMKPNSQEKFRTDAALLL